MWYGRTPWIIGCGSWAPASFMLGRLGAWSVITSDIVSEIFQLSRVKLRTPQYNIVVGVYCSSSTPNMFLLPHKEQKTRTCRPTCFSCLVTSCLQCVLKHLSHVVFCNLFFKDWQFLRDIYARILRSNRQTANFHSIIANFDSLA